MTLVLAIGVAALCLIAYTATLRTLDDEVDRALVREAQAYAAAMKSSIESTSLVGASRSYLEGRAGAVAGPDPILVVLADGRVLSNSAVRVERATGNLAARTPTSSPASYTNVRYEGTTYRVLSAPIATPSGYRIGLFQAALSAETPRTVAASVAGALGAAGLAVVLIGALLSVWAARGSLAPLRRMAADAAGITHASPGGRIAYDGPADELGSLAASLNAMLDRLERSYDDQRRFVADASHELRTPVAVIRGNVELLRSGKSSPADAEESLQMIEAESLRMSRLLDELLSLARLERAVRAFQPIEVRTLVDEVAARMRALGGREISVEGTLGAWVSGDLDLLDQAFLNVAKNAHAHTREGGHIRLTCEIRGNWVRVTVTDDGPGIPPEDLARIFDRFYRAMGPRPGDSGGAGLGLAIAKRLVDLHDGRITAENVAPTGARFTIELPRVLPPAGFEDAAE